MNVCPLKFSVNLFVLAILFFGTCLSADSIDDPEALQALQGTPVQQVLNSFSNDGLKLLFSTNYVPPTMLVLIEPMSRDPLQIIDEILEPHGLELKQVDGSYLVVKSITSALEPSTGSVLIVIRDLTLLGSLEDLKVASTPEITRREKHGPGMVEFFPSTPGNYTIEVQLPGYEVSRSTVQINSEDPELLSVKLEPEPTELERISVSASRYILFSNSQFVIDQRALQALPQMGEDPIRSVHRLQGVAASGFSSKSHFRGGGVNETSIYLNGAKLLDPFHIRDFHSIFSSIDTQAISSIQVYTGGFPTEYGDDMSGVLMLESKPPEKPLHTELGLSLFYTSALNSGYSKEGGFDWLISARRSNLDIVLDKDIGDPQYFDVFATLGFNPSANTRISLNGLLTDDEVIVVTENDPDGLEKSTSTTNNKTAWLNVENTWGNHLSASTSLTTSSFSNRRVAVVSDPEEMFADVFDYRTVQINRLRHSMKYDGLDNHLLKWGLEFSRQKARYDYRSRAEYFGYVDAYPGLENPVEHQVKTNPEGNTYALFVSDRIAFNEQLSVELGMRWDKQTYTKPNYSSQFSPRASLLYSFGNQRNFRFTIGRYHQSQRIHELQVEDNIDQYFKPQYADHVIAGYQWASVKNYRFRIEAYYKDYQQLAPRFENLFDPLQMLPELQLDRVRLDPESANAKGLEFSVEYNGNNEFSWWASYTLSRVTDSIGGDSQRRSWDQLHALQFGLGWQRNNWELGFATRLHSGWPTTDLSLDFDSELDSLIITPGPRNNQQFGAFASLDFRISRHFDVRIGKLTGFFEATNTTNRNNPCCVDYGVDEDLEGTISLDKKVEYWLPIIPSIGLLWEF